MPDAANGNLFRLQRRGNIQTGIILVSVLLVGWWLYAVLKRLGQPHDPFATPPAKGTRIPRPKRSYPTGGTNIRPRHWLSSAPGGRRRSLAPHAGLALLVLVFITAPPAAFAVGTAQGAHDSNGGQGAVAQLSATGTPSPSPSPTPSPSDVAAEATPPSPAIVNPTPSPTPEPIAPRPTIWPQPTPRPTPRPTPTPPPPPPPTPTDNPPTAILNATPVGGAPPLRVTANASFSWDRDATGIVGYQFNWGDGLTTNLQASPTATHLYSVSGSYRLTVIVVDSAGLSSTASTIIKVG